MKLLTVISLLIFSYAQAQEVFQNGDKFGLKYNGVVFYSATYDKIIITDYFVYGKKNEICYNLSSNKNLSTKQYRRFNFNLASQLLVIGVTREGKRDLLDETGQHVYLEDGDYDRIFSRSEKIIYGNNDILLISKNGKIGLYNWTQKTEIIAPEFNKVIVHESCANDSYIIYTKKKGQNSVVQPSGKILFSFKSSSVQDLYQSTICSGYILKRNQKIGYCMERASGRYFLIKPAFDDLFFPTNDPKIIIVERFGKYGLYYNFQPVLKCKYDSIEIIDNPYLIARVIKNDKEMKLNVAGKLVR